MSEIKRIQDWNKTVGVPNKFDPEKADLYLDLITEEYEETKEAFSKFKYTDKDLLSIEELYSNLLKECADLIVVTTGLIHSLGQDADAVLKVVNDSNYSKFLTSATAEEKRVELLKMAAKYRSDIESKDINNHTVFLRAKDGKVLKPSSYKPADLSKFKLSDNE